MKAPFMRISKLLFKNVYLRPSQIHKLRGFIGNMFRDHDLIHNHDAETGKLIYRYPLIQFKVLDRIPTVIAVTDDAVKLFSRLFLELDQVVIDGITIPVFEKDLRIETAELGYTHDTCAYQFVSPWLALNQKNYFRYEAGKTSAEKASVLKKALIGNILSMSKNLGIWLEKDQQIYADIRVEETPVKLKGKSMSGFTGFFKTNFLIPDGLGIGKSVSRGFGTVRRII